MIQLAIDVIVKAAIGFGVGTISQTNQKLWASVLAVQSIASFILAKLSERGLSPKFSANAINEGARAITYFGAIAATNQLGLISLRVAGLFAFFNLAFLLGRIKWLNSQPA